MCEFARVGVSVSVSVRPLRATLQHGQVENVTACVPCVACRYVLKTLRDTRPGDIDQALLSLPFADVLSLLPHLHHALRKGVAVELAAKCVLLLLKLHHKQVGGLLLCLCLCVYSHGRHVVVLFTGGFGLSCLRIVACILVCVVDS